MVLLLFCYVTNSQQYYECVLVFTQYLYFCGMHIVLEGMTGFEVAIIFSKNNRIFVERNAKAS